MQRRELEKHVSYDPETGTFRWLRLDSKRIGKQAGYIDKKGYRRIEICNRAFMAHRLAWFYMTSQWPKYSIDHINGDKDDNRFCNLREATNAENKRNGPPRIDSRSQLKGIYRDNRTGRWVVKLQLAGDNRQSYCGTFTELADAIVCSNSHIASGHGSFARLNKMPEGWCHD